MIRTLYRFKDLILYKAWADLRSEARRYYISYLWWIIEPILEMLIFYLIFGILLSRGGPNFIQFLLIGLVTFKWFGNTIQHCCNSIINSRGIIGQSPIPKIIFPTIHILIDTFKASIVMLLVCIYLNSSGFGINAAYIALPMVFLVELFLIIGVGYTVSAIVPFFPDLSIIISLLMRILFYLSGIFYDPSMISESKRQYFFMNPIAKIIDINRGILMHRTLPEFIPLLKISLISILLIIMSSAVINKFDTVYPRVVIR